MCCLQVVGNALRWSESVQGASLLAVGSSFPEFVTALVGVIFFPEDNPGLTASYHTCMHCCLFFSGNTNSNANANANAKAKANAKANANANAKMPVPMSNANSVFLLCA